MNRMTDLEQLAAMLALDTVADLFDVSPRKTLTPHEVAGLIRGFRRELFEPLVVEAYDVARAMEIQSANPS